MNKYIVILFCCVSAVVSRASELDSQAVLKGVEVVKMTSNARAQYLLSFATLVQMLEEAQNIETNSSLDHLSSNYPFRFPVLRWMLQASFAGADESDKPMPLMDGRSVQDILKMAKDGGRALAQMNRKPVKDAVIETRKVGDSCLYGAHVSKFKYYEKPSASGSRVRCPRPENTICHSKKGDLSRFRCQDFGLSESAAFTAEQIEKNFCIPVQPSSSLTSRCLTAFRTEVKNSKAQWLADDYDLMAEFVRKRVHPVDIISCRRVAQAKECAALKTILKNLKSTATSMREIETPSKSGISNSDRK